MIRKNRFSLTGALGEYRPITFVYRFDEMPQPSEAVVYVEEAENDHTSDAS